MIFIEKLVILPEFGVHHSKWVVKNKNSSDFRNFIFNLIQFEIIALCLFLKDIDYQAWQVQAFVLYVQMFY